MKHLHYCTLFAALACAGQVARPSEVKVVGDKCIVVDGKPLFVIGVYSAGGVVDLPLLAEAGFNTVHSYSWEGKRHHDGGKAWLDAAHANGLKALVGLYRPDVKNMDFAASIKRIEKYRDHPALLAWHIMDEPSWDKPGNRGKDYMPAAYKLIKEHDPRHPVTAVVCHFADNKLFEPTVDVMQADYYCVPPIPPANFSGTGFRGVKVFTDGWRKASAGKKPFWYVGQIFDFSVSKEKGYEIPDEWKRLPTGAELRCATYTAVASGARGVLYWSLSRLIRDEWNRGLLPRVKLWEELTKVVGELNQLMPVLTADTPETFHSENHVAAMIKSDGRDTYVIACNYERKPTKTVIEVPGVQAGGAEVMFTGGRAAIVDGKLEAAFAAMESRVYRIKGVPKR